MEFGFVIKGDFRRYISETKHTAFYGI